MLNNNTPTDFPTLEEAAAELELERTKSSDQMPYSPLPDPSGELAEEASRRQGTPPEVDGSSTMPPEAPPKSAQLQEAPIDTPATEPLLAAKSVEEPIEVQPDTEADLLSPIHSDVGNSERFVVLFGRNVRYCPKLKKWLVWDGKRWKGDDLDYVVKLAKKTMLEFYYQALKEDDSGDSTNVIIM